MVKLTKYFLEIILGLIFTATTSTLTGQNLKVKIYNKTGNDINSLEVGETFIGNISRDSSTIFLKLPVLLLDSGYPREKISGVINGVTLKEYLIIGCATEWTAETEGEFILDLTIKHLQNNDYLFLGLN